MRLVLTVEDTPKGPHIGSHAESSGTLDHPADSLACHLIANWMLFLKEQKDAGAVSVTGLYTEA
jgi:hypothetical protein